jgi:N6-adenosine-specific RNA methylase IME4
MNVLARKSLKDRLDRIDNEIRSKGAKAVYEINLLELHGAWRKGREVLRAYPELEDEKPRKGGRGVSEVSFATVAMATGRSDKTIASWAKLFLAHEDQEEFSKWAKDEARARVEKWQAKLLPAPKPANPALPSDKYRVIYADPPWQYSDRLIEGYGAAEHHYRTMSLEELCDQKFAELSRENAVLFLWATSPFLEDCFPVVRAWGFEYKSSFIWDKVKHNYGHYNSVRHEVLLVCTKGSCTPDVPTLIDSVVQVARNDEHSEKPEKFREIIDTLYTPPSGRTDRIELFRRGAAPVNWHIWGDEAHDALLQKTA